MEFKYPTLLGGCLAFLCGAALAQTADDAACRAAKGQQAIDICSRVIQSSQDTDAARSQLYFARGSGYYDLRQYDKAIADYTQSFTLNSAMVGSLLNRGVTYLNMKLYDRAIADFTQAISLQPNAANSYYFRALAYGDQNTLDSALVDLNRAIALQPDYPDAFNARCYDLARANRLLDIALADCDRSLASGPNDQWRLDSRAFVKLRLGDNAGAIKDATAALAADPKYGLSLYTRGLAETRSGNASAGKADMDAALVLAPTVAKRYADDGVLTAARSPRASDFYPPEDIYGFTNVLTNPEAAIDDNCRTGPPATDLPVMRATQASVTGIDGEFKLLAYLKAHLHPHISPGVAEFILRSVANSLNPKNTGGKPSITCRNADPKLSFVFAQTDQMASAPGQVLWRFAYQRNVPQMDAESRAHVAANVIVHEYLHIAGFLDEPFVDNTAGCVANFTYGDQASVDGNPIPNGRGLIFVPVHSGVYYGPPAPDSCDKWFASTYFTSVEAEWLLHYGDKYDTDAKEAERIYTADKALEHGDPVWNFFIATALEYQGQWAKADALMKAAIKLHPEWKGCDNLSTAGNDCPNIKRRKANEMPRPSR